MEAILKFNLPEETEEFNTAVSAGKYYSVLWDLDQLLRSIVKYGSEEDQSLTAQGARDKLHELLSEHGVSL